jgi:hypothetical protein
MKTARRILLATVFIFAFVAASTTSVQAMTRYEYKVIQVDKTNVANNQQLELLFNQLGQDGWLLIETSATGAAVFRREK